MSTKSKCKAALESVKSALSTQEYRNCDDYISAHGEWLLGLEFAIDYLTESQSKVSIDSYQQFKDAFIEMVQEGNSKLKDLKSLVSDNQI